MISKPGLKSIPNPVLDCEEVHHGSSLDWLEPSRKHVAKCKHTVKEPNPVIIKNRFSALSFEAEDDDETFPDVYFGNDKLHAQVPKSGKSSKSLKPKKLPSKSSNDMDFDVLAPEPVAFVTDSKSSAKKAPSNKKSKSYAKVQKKEEMLSRVFKILKEVVDYIDLVDENNTSKNTNKIATTKCISKPNPASVSRKMLQQVADSKKQHQKAPVQLCFPPSHIVPVNYLDGQVGGLSRLERQNQQYHEACQRVS
jgi:hypothetical protein